MIFGKYLSVIITPFNPNNTVNYDEAIRIGKMMVSGGVEGLIVAATAGESSTLTLEERVGITKAFKNAFPGIPILTGVGTNNTSESLEQTAAVTKAGADGLLINTPYYTRPSQEGLYRHFKAMGEAAQLPCLIYNVPARTGVGVEPATLARLVEIPSIKGLKDCTSSAANIIKTRKVVPDDFMLYTGEDMQLLPALSVGAYGLISVVAQVAPRQIKDVMDEYFKGEKEKAMQLYSDLYPLLETMFICSNPSPVKAAFAMMGYRPGKVRLPMVMPTKAQAQKIAETLKAFGIIGDAAIDDTMYDE